MNDGAEGNEHHIRILDNLIDYGKPHYHIHSKEEKPVQWYIIKHLQN